MTLAHRFIAVFGLVLGVFSVSPVCGQQALTATIQGEGITVVVKDAPLEVRVTAKEASDAEILTLNDPPRVVIDLPRSKMRGAGKPRRFEPKTKSAEVKGLRVGYSPGKIRLVVDVTSPLPETFTRSVTGSELLVSFGNAEAPTIAAAPEPPDAPSVRSAQRIAMEVPPAVQEPTPVPVVTPAAAVPGGRVLQRIDFVRDDESTKSVHFVFSERGPFKFTRADDRTFKLVVNDAGLSVPGLTLPHFPPQDFIGFTVVHATQSGERLEVVIGTDRGVRLTAIPSAEGVMVRVR